MRSSTPSHDMAAEPKATQPPKSCSTTPSLDSAAELKPARPPPVNPYRTPTRSTSPPRGDTTSPTILSLTELDDNDHRPPPPAGTGRRHNDTNISFACQRGFRVDGGFARNGTPDHAAHTSHSKRPHPYGYVGHKISSRIFTGNGGPDGDVGDGGGVGFRAYGQQTPLGQ